jgi:arabinose-5-phosphate isomerase
MAFFLKITTTGKMNQMMKRTTLSERGQSYLSDFSQAISNIQLDENFEEAVRLISESNTVYGDYCKQYKIVTTGMGKAGAAMRKFSSLLCSLGFASCYLHPGESSHGDLGILEVEDVLFVASTSGKTREVLETIQLAKNLGVHRFVGITSHKDSPIRDEVNVCLDMGDITEVGELGLAPTTSILVMLAITDALAIVASEHNGLTKEEYSKYHHGGYLGSAARGDNIIN